MEIKTSELIGPALNWAVAECEGRRRLISTVREFGIVKPVRILPDYINNWAQGGPIIDAMMRRGIRIIGTKCRYTTDEPWFTVSLNGYYTSHGPTPLIAAMRCYVASKMGDAVDVPEELTK